mmetsp:Transcript_15282/g.24848  ORF Transcript_15282/g.24848 Transcript_15282/m.24848 type:complete len:338 (+) Transcript_15282:49-1062(+)
MHGRTQKSRAAAAAESPETKRLNAEKFRKLRGLLGTCLECRNARDTSPEALALTDKLLCINPSVNTLWNIKRDAVRDKLREIGADGQAREELVKIELEANALALRKGNVKSHEGWSHRAWVIRVAGDDGKYVDLDNELDLCQQLIAADERNFFVYQHRRYVSRLAGNTVVDDLNFAHSLIERNFSNYAAWHLKLRAMEAQEASSPLTCEALREEFEFVSNAVFTEPDDQSGWMFHRWLVSHLDPVRHDQDLGFRYKLVLEQIALYEELNEMEENESKWALLALTRLVGIQNKYSGFCQVDVQANQKRIYDMYQMLERIDPGHKNYYKHLAQKLKLKK